MLLTLAVEFVVENLCVRVGGELAHRSNSWTMG